MPAPFDEFHLLRQGTTRVGKSIATYVELAQAVACPDVVVAGCDPTGLTLGDFMGPRHAGWQSVGTDDVEIHVDMLKRIVAEMDDRLAILRETRTDKLDAFVRPDLPLMLVVLEEYPGLIDLAKGQKPQAAKEIQRLVSRLMAESAKVAMRVRIVAQRADADVLGGFVRNNISVRQTLRVEGVEATRMLHPNLDPDEQAEATRFAPGVCLFRSFEHADVRMKVPYIDGYQAYRDAVERAAWHRIHHDPSEGDEVVFGHEANPAPRGTESTERGAA